MNQSNVKAAAMFAGGVLLTMFVFNTLSNRIDLVKKAREKVDSGLA